MKRDLHPIYRDVIYMDVTTGWTFKTRSTASSNETIEWSDGRTYPLVRIDISSSSHPYYTGKERIADTEGRVARFRKKYEKKSA